MNNRNRIIILVLVLIIIVGSILYLNNKKVRRSSSVAGVSTVASSSPDAVQTADYQEKANKYPKAQELVSPDGYINTNNSPVTISSLIGKKVILVDFWTYSCINCQRTIPYLNSWYEKYKDQGLEIIGVHTPEFDFEKKLENVQAAVNKFNIKYPVALDNNYATWDAYKNQYWPEHYLIDINGLVVDRHIGEGGYADTEKMIQRLLQERKIAMGESGSIRTDITTINDQIQSSSPETYFGWSRNSLLANGKPQTPGDQTLTISTTIDPNKLYLDGTWNFSGQYAENKTAEAKIVFKYSAKNVYFVGSSEKGVSITVLRDGKPVQAQKGEDIDSSGKGMIKESRLYKLINESELGTHTIEIRVHGAGLDAFTFTFG